MGISQRWKTAPSIRCNIQKTSLSFRRQDHSWSTALIYSRLELFSQQDIPTKNTARLKLPIIDNRSLAAKSLSFTLPSIPSHPGRGIDKPKRNKHRAAVEGRPYSRASSTTTPFRRCGLDFPNLVGGNSQLCKTCPEIQLRLPRNPTHI